MNKEKFKTNTKIGDKGSRPKRWQWVMQGLFFIPSYLLLVLASIILFFADILMFDTHHLKIEVKPK